MAAYQSSVQSLWMPTMSCTNTTVNANGPNHWIKPRRQHAESSVALKGWWVLHPPVETELHNTKRTRRRRYYKGDAVRCGYKYGGRLLCKIQVGSILKCVADVGRFPRSRICANAPFSSQRQTTDSEGADFTRMARTRRRLSRRLHDA